MTTPLPPPPPPPSSLDPANVENSPPPGWLWFTPAQVRIVRLLLDCRPRKLPQIETDLGGDVSLKDEMAALGQRNIVLRTASGYRLNLDAQRCRAVREWLECEGR
jgi:hypothetical protein